MTALNLKLLRDLWNMRGQALAIAAVIAGGVATLVMALSTYDSLLGTRDLFYRDYRFAQVFASLKRAPDGLAARLAEIPGVERLETRVVAVVKLEVEGFTDPVTGVLASLPNTGQPLLNTLHLKRGRWLSSQSTGRPEIDLAPSGGGTDRRDGPGAQAMPYSGDEVIVSDTFADAHQGQGLALAVDDRVDPVAGIRLPDRPRGHVPGLQALRRAVDGAPRPGHRV